jgi:serine/threonine-protein kinase RsbW
MSNKSPDVFLQVSAELHYLPAIGQFTKNLFMHHPLLKGMENLIFNLELVVSESCSNVVRHAYPEDDPGPLVMKIWFVPEKVTIQIIDHGPGFDPQKVPPPDFEDPKEGGMGLYIIQQSVDCFQYIQDEKANTLHLELNL